MFIAMGQLRNAAEVFAQAGELYGSVDQMITLNHNDALAYKIIGDYELAERHYVNAFHYIYVSEEKKSWNMNNHNNSTILLTNIYDNYKQWSMFGCGNASNDDGDHDSNRRKEQQLHQLHEVFATFLVLLYAVGYKSRSTIDIYGKISRCLFESQRIQLTIGILTSGPNARHETQQNEH